MGLVIFFAAPILCLADSEGTTETCSDATCATQNPSPPSIPTFRVPVPEGYNKDLFGLVMIVKNEAYQLRPLLKSVLPYIDHWAILDTGSTDGTQDMIREELGSIPGELFEEPFVDYSYSRNRALQLYGNRTVYRLMMDGGDELIDGPKMRQYLQSIRDKKDIECIKIEWRWSGQLLMVPHLCRTDAPWKYFGRVHNYLARLDGTFPWVNCHSCVVKHTVPNTEEEAERHRKKWFRDIEVLKDELEKNPSDGRSSFYLAQSYSSVGMMKEAFLEYQRSYAIKGWIEREYMSAARAARLCEDLSTVPWETCQDWYMKAYQAMPNRAEPLLHIGRHYRTSKKYNLCYAYMSLAMRIPFPEEASQDISRTTYEREIPDDFSVCAYYTNHHEEGLYAARLAAKADPKNKRLQENVKHNERELAKQQRGQKRVPKISLFSIPQTQQQQQPVVDDASSAQAAGVAALTELFTTHPALSILSSNATALLAQTQAQASLSSSSTLSSSSSSSALSLPVLDEATVEHLAKTFVAAQHAVAESALAARLVKAHASGRVAVFGAGSDIDLWTSLISSAGGSSVIFEHDPDRVDALSASASNSLTSSSSSSGAVVIESVRYHTYLRDADLLLGQDRILELRHAPPSWTSSSSSSQETGAAAGERWDAVVVDVRALEPIGVAVAVNARVQPHGPMQALYAAGRWLKQQKSNKAAVIVVGCVSKACTMFADRYLPASAKRMEESGVRYYRL